MKQYFLGCSSSDTSEKYSVPSLKDLDKDSHDCGPNLFPGGETEALDRMDRMLKKTVRIKEGGGYPGLWTYLCTFSKKYISEVSWPVKIEFTLRHHQVGRKAA